MQDVILRMEDITKRFGDFAANDSITLELHRGEVLTVLGENGAGKSTLMNILCGLYRPTSGKLYLNGAEITLNSPSDAVKLGIGMVHQHFMLIDAMTVFQNIILGISSDKSVWIKQKKLRADISKLSQRYGLDIEFDKKISDLSVGAQQRVEILKALWRGAEVLILDEPTAVLTDEETQGLFQIIRRLKEENKSTIFISHKLKEVMQISDRIVVLRHGRLVQEVAVSEADEQSLANTMVGRQLQERIYRKVEKPGRPALSMKEICYNKAVKHNGLHDINLDINEGEIFCVAGVDGNGQGELASLAAGLITPDEGEMYYCGKRVDTFAPMPFIRSGISHVPGDRNRMGLIGEMTVAENLIMKSQPEKNFYKWNGWCLNRGVIRNYAEAMQEKCDIRCRCVEQDVRQLSGGNRQKVILARELDQSPRLLIAVHPTRGLDIGAATFVHDRMIEARDAGCAILLISTDLTEVLTMADRFCVMFEGGIMGTYSGVNPPLEEVSLAMAGKRCPVL